jgi:hypothetical protein
MNRRRRFDVKKPRALTPADLLCRGVLATMGFDVNTFAIFEVWDRLLGAEASKARAVGLKGRKLYVEVDSHVRWHDLTLRKPALLQRLNGHFSQQKPISDIMISLANSRRETGPATAPWSPPLKRFQIPKS